MKCVADTPLTFSGVSTRISYTVSVCLSTWGYTYVYAVGGHFGRMELGDLCVLVLRAGESGNEWYQYVDR